MLRALVQGSAERLVPLVAGLPERQSLPGWQLRVFDGNHLPASEKRLAPLRGFRGAALPGFAVAVLAYNVLALLKQLIEHAHRQNHPELDVSTYHLAVDIASGYGPMPRMFPPEHLPRANDDSRQLRGNDYRRFSASGEDAIRH